MASVDSSSHSPAPEQNVDSDSKVSTGGVGASDTGGLDEDGYPPQRHTGAVGYGPEYGKGAGTSDKLQGLKEEMKGKLFRKPDLVQHGHDLRTGEVKKQEAEARDNEPMI